MECIISAVVVMFSFSFEFAHHHVKSKGTPPTDTAMARWRHSCRKKASRARLIRPQAQKPIQPQKVRHRLPTNSRGRTKFTTITPARRKTKRISHCIQPGSTLSRVHILPTVAIFRLLYTCINGIFSSCQQQLVQSNLEANSYILDDQSAQGFGIKALKHVKC